MPDLVDVTTAEPEAVAAEMARRQALKVMGIASVSYTHLRAHET